MKLGPNQIKWIEELESGRYKQGSGGLANLFGRYCCLGVGCEIFGIKKTGPDIRNFYNYDGNRDLAPQKLIDLLGLCDGAGNGRLGSSVAALTTLNDTGRSFWEIAQILRTNPDQYFVEGR